MKYKLPVVHEKSCGILVFHQLNGGEEFLLLHYPSGHWDLPKGHVEEGENEIETALRELEEETGMSSVDIKEGFREKIHYDFRRHAELVSKDVIFFLGEVSDKEVQISHEHKGFKWLSYEKALNKMTFENARGILKKGKKYIEKLK